MRVVHFFLPLFLWLFYFNVQAQDEPYGDVSVEDLKMTVYAQDTSAQAVVLFDKGVVKLDGNSLVGTTFRRNIRIKIFDHSAASRWASFQFTFPDGSELKVDAATYNLVNGKPIPSKLTNSDIHKTKADKYNQKVTFALPGVRAGSVLDISWTLRLRDFYLPSWTFQEVIPTIVSEYKIYGLFNLKPHLSGAIQPKLEMSKHNNTYSEYVLTNIPAFKEEPLMPDPSVYLSQVRFVENSKWESIAVGIMRNGSFHGGMDQNNFIEATAHELTKGVEGLQMVKVISDYIKANVKWNGIRDYVAYPLQNVLEKKSGTSADINLLFASMMRHAGLDVQNVLISTRDHGFVEEALPDISQFNYVVCLVTIGDRELLVDATEKGLAFDLLPPRCFNHKGFLVSKKQYGWIGIEPIRKAKTSVTANLKIDEVGQMEGNVVLGQDDYAALSYRSAKSDSVKMPGDIFGEHMDDLKLVSTENENNESLTLIRKFDLQPINYADVAGANMYISPYPFLRIKENEFKDPIRNYPIDFGMMSERTSMFKFTLPKGYKIRELPKSENFGMTGNAAKFTLSVTPGEEVTIVSRLQINKTLFMPDEYPSLREFYSRIVAKMAEVIVLEKK
ncbi:MAG: DUF3857 domain-containing protein [Chryseolinea sp.]